MDHKDSICIAQHIKAFVEQCKYEKTADFAEPCIACQLNHDCDFNAYKHFRSLSDETDIEITQLIKLNTDYAEPASRLGNR